MLPAQRQALVELWSRYGVTGTGDLSLEAVFGRVAPCYVEIGFGMGDALLEMAGRHPKADYLGIDVHLPGVGQLLLNAHERGLLNVRVDRRDAVEVLACLPSASLAGVFLFFPDPWLKKRHHKRRLVQAGFVNTLSRVIRSGGFFHVTTDWADYARHIVEVMEGADGFCNRSPSGTFHPRPEERPLTKFELRGLRRGHTVRDLIYDRL